MRTAQAGRFFSLLLLAVPAAAAAQTPWAERARISINVGMEQPAPTTLMTTTTTNTVGVATAVKTSYAVPRGVLFDGGVLIRIAGGFGVGAAVSVFSTSAPATVAGTIPIPAGNSVFSFVVARPISGTTPLLEHSETAVHVQAAYVISSNRVDVAIAGGPTFFNVSQDLVTDVIAAEPHPLADNFPLYSVKVSNVSATAVGFNAGVDVGVRLSKNVGVGGLVRFSRASVTFQSGVGTDVGGLQAGGGVRFWF
jgi:hypothetical protein